MPFISKHYRKLFKWREVDGLPVATVTELNGRLWLMVCPLCGNATEILKGEIGKPAKPDCTLRKLAAMPMPRGGWGANWRRLLQDWYTQHPEAAAHDTVLLLDAAAVEALDAQQRKAARRAKRNPEGRKRGRPRKYGELEQAA